MRSFNWKDGERAVHFGRGRVAEAAELVGGPGYVLVTTERASQPELVEGAAEVLHVPPGRVDEVAAELLGTEGERFVALGGGRVIDTAKALAAAHGARSMAIPTTLSGAEMTWVHRHAAGVPADTPRKRPAVVVCDPALAASQPEPELAASALNALGHAVEAPVTTLANPVATLAADEAARLIRGAYDIQEMSDGPRDDLALAALLAGYSIDSAWYGLHHVLSQTLVRLTDIGHGPANAIMVQHTIGALRERGGDGDADLARRICALTGATRLSELGVTDDQLDECADAAAQRDELALTPPRATRDELRALYAAAF